ncbi:NAD(P)-dependent oxidoreductase [Kordiimonas lipolytica]|uniref:NAD(P)-dependent oxidoreductase n=2 Tax=Kordiimonas lipolytica TaxID=1662421 RepID=A0ABV8U8H1_9PROT
MMNILIFGAAGDVGRRAVSEAVARGHTVTAVVRRAGQSTTLPLGVACRVANIHPDSVPAALMEGQDLVISALRPPEGQEALLAGLTRAICLAARAAGARLLVVGGAASLKLPGKDTTVLTEPGFLPEHLLPIAQACQEQYELFESMKADDWAYQTPPAMLVPGERTGQYRRGLDEMLTDEEGNSQISMEDFAVALIDEAELGLHKGRRYTVAY